MLIDKIIGTDRFEGTLNLNNSSATKLPVIEGFRVMGGSTINANPSDAVSLPVEEILGDLTLTKMGGCPSFEMPNLKRVGGEFEAVITTLTKATSFTLPALETIGGNMTFATGRPGTPQSIGMPAPTRRRRKSFCRPDIYHSSSQAEYGDHIARFREADSRKQRYRRQPERPERFLRVHGFGSLYRCYAVECDRMRL